MDVILRSDVAHLGKAGEMVKVKDGFARNFLIPSGLAYHATEGNKRRVEAEANRRVSQAATEQSVAAETAAKLEQISLTFMVKAGEGDRLFGSVTAGDIAAKLGEAGHPVDKRAVELDEPLRSIGVFKVPVRLHPTVKAEVRVWVVKE